MSDAPSRIRLLPDTLINQIAAGEVVERPLSVVKELLENSLDAGATRVDIDVEKGGVGLIRIRDNGRGIHPEDLALALSRHATSKLRTAAELHRLSTLGFRGEALPSIGAVSRLTLTSRWQGSDLAWSLRLEGGSLGADPEPAAHGPGTTVEVRDLFYNTPVRRRFLRSERTEWLHIQDLVRRLACSRPDLALTLTHNQRRLLQVRAARDVEGQNLRLRTLCGSAFMSAALPVARRIGTLELHGWLGSPEFARSQSDLQYLFLNGRMIRDLRIQHAVRRAYEDLIPEGRYPAFVLHLGTDADAADVNVHPSKLEVRWRDPRSVHDFVYSAVRAVLASGGLFSPAEARRLPLGSAPVPAMAGRRGLAEAWAVYERLPPERGEVETPGPLGEPLVRLGPYLLARAGDDLLLVDVPAARAWLAARALRAAAARRDVRRRPLLEPVAVTVTEAEADRLEAQAALLAGLGVGLDRAGPGSVVVRELPAVIGAAVPAAVLRRLLDVRGPAADSDGGAGGWIDALAACAAEDGSASSSGLLRELERAGLGAEGRYPPGVCRRLDRTALRRLLERA